MAQNSTKRVWIGIVGAIGVIVVIATTVIKVALNTGALTQVVDTLKIDVPQLKEKVNRNTEQLIGQKKDGEKILEILIRLEQKVDKTNENIQKVEDRLRNVELEMKEKGSGSK